MADISVRFWGVRGSIACPGEDVVRYGGNTACVEIRCADRAFIFDAGTGARALGQELARNASVNTDIFLSHCHIDHICGLPFFAPCYLAGSEVRLWAGNLLPEYRLEQVVRTMMAEPLFPTGVETFKADVQFRDFHAGATLEPHPNVTLRTAALNHPGGATGYRLEYGDGIIAYVTDTEHRPGQLDKNVLGLAEGADLMIYDCNYTEDEWPSHVGWGHSTWEEGVRLADAAGAKVLAVFHHDPEHDDRFLDRVADEAASRRPGTIVAAEGTTLSI